jgi:hypothetical protein
MSRSRLFEVHSFGNSVTVVSIGAKYTSEKRNRRDQDRHEKLEVEPQPDLKLAAFERDRLVAGLEVGHCPDHFAGGGVCVNG